MIAAGLALFFGALPKALGYTPIYPDHSAILYALTKIVGMGGGIAMLIGGILLISHRMSGKEEIGQTGYADWLFLWIIFLVGITGMLSTIFHWISTPLFGYIDYYIHILLVFFLLWYAPYSKFGHMFYRTLALTYAKSIGIDQPRKK